MSITSFKPDSRPKVIVCLSAGLAVLLGTLQLFFYLNGYEFDTGLYLHGPFSTLTLLAWMIAGIVVVALSLTLPKKQLCEEFKIPRSSLIEYSTLLVFISLIGYLLSIFLFSKNPADPLRSLLASTVQTDSTARSMLLLSLLMATFAAMHYLVFYYKSIQHPLGIAAVLFFTSATALRVYFDMRYLLMSPRRILHLMALLAVMLFLIAELRVVRGLSSPKGYFSLSALAVIFAFADSISNLLLSLMGWQTLGSEVTVYFFLLAMAIFAFSRMFSAAYPEFRKKSAFEKLFDQFKNESISDDIEPTQSEESAE